MPVIQNATISPVEIFNQRWPDGECPKAMTLDMNFAAFDSYELNLLLSQTRGFLAWVQSCSYFNRDNNADVFFECGDTGFRTVFQANFQGMRPLVLANPPRGVFSCTGGTGVFRILLSNTPFQPWDQIAT